MSLHDIPPERVHPELSEEIKRGIATYLGYCRSGSGGASNPPNVRVIMRDGDFFLKLNMREDIPWYRVTIKEWPRYAPNYQNTPFTWDMIEIE